MCTRQNVCLSVGIYLIMQIVYHYSNAENCADTHTIARLPAQTRTHRHTRTYTPNAQVANAPTVRDTPRYMQCIRIFCNLSIGAGETEARMVKDGVLGPVVNAVRCVPETSSIVVSVTIVYWKSNSSPPPPKNIRTRLCIPMCCL